MQIFSQEKIEIDGKEYILFLIFLSVVGNFSNIINLTY